MHSDPIADMLTRIRNGGMARLDRVDVPLSRLKKRIAEILKTEGYIEDWREVSGKAPGHGVIELKLRYADNRDPVIRGLQRVSRPGLRQYVGCSEIPKVRNGLGIMIMSTSRGVMTDQQARRERVGGEALCAVW